jgi:hypothetical protein
MRISFKIGGGDCLRAKRKFGRPWTSCSCLCLGKFRMIERNARVFRNHAPSTTMLIIKIKDKATLWSVDGAKVVCNALPGEWASVKFLGFS